MAMSWTLDHLAEYTVVDIARPETFDLECVNPYFFSALEWQEAFAAEQPIQSAREWLVRKAACAEDDAEIVAYESVYWVAVCKLQKLLLCICFLWNLKLVSLKLFTT